MVYVGRILLTLSTRIEDTAYLYSNSRAFIGLLTGLEKSFDNSKLFEVCVRTECLESLVWVNPKGFFTGLVWVHVSGERKEQ